MVGVRRVDGQWKICIEFSEKKPGSRLRVDQISVLSYPAESSSLSERFLHHRRAVGKSPVGEGAYFFGNLVG